MSDFWKNARGGYSLCCPEFEALASKQHARAICALAQRDALEDGIDVELGDDGFTQAAALASEVFPGRGPWIRIRVRPDPWKSHGRWRVLGNCGDGAIEGYADMRQVEKYFGSKT